MPKRFFIWVLSCVLLSHAKANTIETIYSPDKNISFRVLALPTGQNQFRLAYEMDYKQQPVIKTSGLSFVLKSPDVSLVYFTVTDKKLSTVNENWKPVWGEVNNINNHYNQLILKLKTNQDILIQFMVRVYNEGAGFRFEFPQQPQLSHFIIGDEKTQFAMAGNHHAFWIPGDYDSNDCADSQT